MSGKNALCFLRAVLAYFALSKTLPYPSKREENKAVDISYKNFLPLNYCINGISQKLSDNISDSLLENFKNDDFPIEDFEMELFTPEKRFIMLNEAEFEEKKQKFLKKQQKKINGKRLFNRYFALGSVCFAAFFILSLFIINAVFENRKKPCTIGLSSWETTELFYSGIHHMDTDLMLASAKDCPEAQGYISRIPQIYIVSQMKSAYNFESGLSTPENWMFFEPLTSRSSSHFIYGITNFTIDDVPSSLNQKSPTIKNHKKKLWRDGNVRLSELSKKEHTVRYYLVHNVDETIQIEQFTTVVHLRWKKDRWQISHLDEVSFTDNISPFPYSSDLKEALSLFDNDVIKAVDSLRKKYPWVPSVQSLDEEKKRLDSIGY